MTKVALLSDARMRDSHQRLIEREFAAQDVGVEIIHLDCPVGYAAAKAEAAGAKLLVVAQASNLPWGKRRLATLARNAMRRWGVEIAIPTMRLRQGIGTSLERYVKGARVWRYEPLGTPPADLDPRDQDPDPGATRYRESTGEELRC